MKYIAQFFFLTIQLYANCQNTFIKTYDLITNSDDQAVWLEKNNDSLYIINSKIFSYYPVFSKFDLKGNFIKGKLINDVSLYNSYVRASDTIFMLAKPINNNFGDTLLVYQFKLNGDSISKTLFKDPYKKYKKPFPTEFLKHKNQYIMIANAYLYDNPDTLDVVSTIWYLNADFSVDTIIPYTRDVYTYAYGAQIGPDDNLYVFNFIHCQDKACPPYTDKRSVTIYKDKKLIKEIFTEPYRYEFYKPRISLVTSDTSIIYGFEKSDISRTKPSIRCANKNGDLKWEQSTLLSNEDRAYTYIKEMKNGDLLAIGYINASSFLRTVYIQKLNKYGNVLWERIIGKHLPGVDYGAEGYVWNFQEDENGNLYVIGQLGGETKDMLLMKVDSFGCINQDKCNDLFVINPKAGLHKYDQLDMKQKKCYYAVRNRNGLNSLHELTFGQDTIMFDDKYGNRRYKHVFTNGVKDTFKTRWDFAGKLNYIKNNLTLLDDDKDSILYDFTLKIGNKFQLPKGYGFATVSKVDSIDLLDGYKRKRLILKHDNIKNQNKYGDLVWIEGIGSPNGLFYFYDWINETKTSLNCYFDRDKKRYGESEDCNATDINTANVKYVSTLNEWINIYNNPLEPIPAYAERSKFSDDSVKWAGKYYHRQLISKSEFGNDFKENRRIFREENGKIYQGVDVAPGEFLIYDFNLKVGDTTRVLTDPSLNYLVCTKTDTVVFLDGNQRKRQEMQCVNTNKIYTWIEGFGEANLYHQYCEEENQSGFVSCYLYDNQISYFKSSSQGCWIVGVNDLNNYDFKIYPNPTSGIITIETTEDFDEIKIYNSLGQELKIINGSSIDISDFSAGIYWLKASKKNKNIFKKIIKY